MIDLDEEKKLLTARETVKTLGITSPRLAKLVTEGKLKAHRVPGRKKDFYDAHEVDALREELQEEIEEREEARRENARSRDDAILEDTRERAELQLHQASSRMQGVAELAKRKRERVIAELEADQQANTAIAALGTLMAGYLAWQIRKRAQQK